MVLTGCAACMAQKKEIVEPPPPSDEYFPQKWINHVSNSGKFKIKFPKKPREYSDVQNGPGGRSTVFFAEHKGLLLYVASYGDSDAHISDAKLFLAEISDMWLDANSARNLQVVKNEDVTFNGYPEKFLHVETEKDVVRIRWITVKQRIYYQFVAAPKRQNAKDGVSGYDKLAMAFLDSFELIGE